AYVSFVISNQYPHGSKFEKVSCHSELGSLPNCSPCEKRALSRPRQAGSPFGPSKFLTLNLQYCESDRFPARIRGGNGQFRPGHWLKSPAKRDFGAPFIGPGFLNWPASPKTLVFIRVDSWLEYWSHA